MATAVKPCANPACNQPGTGSCACCTKANYCGRSCQMADWCRHKEECRGCANPGCDQPGTSSCASCGTVGYCGRTCQSADWPHHKEECPGHLRKMGLAHLKKARAFYDEQNWTQTLHYAELALTKLKQIKDRRLETVEILDDAFSLKFDALLLSSRHTEAAECAQERYSLWAMNHMRHPKMFLAAFALIQTCIHNEKYEDAMLYARTAYEMVYYDADGIIPGEHRQELIAEGSKWLASAICNLSQSGGIPPAEKQKAGEEAITVARKSVEIQTQLYDTESRQVGASKLILARALDQFSAIDDDEVLRLQQEASAIYAQVYGSSSANVGIIEINIGCTYEKRAIRAEDSNDLDRCLANLELSLPHFREAARIHRANNLVDKFESSLRTVARSEGEITRIGIVRALRISSSSSSTAAAGAASLSSAAGAASYQHQQQLKAK